MSAWFAGAHSHVAAVRGAYLFRTAVLLKLPPQHDIGSLLRARMTPSLHRLHTLYHAGICTCAVVSGHVHDTEHNSLAEHSTTPSRLLPSLRRHNGHTTFCNTFSPHMPHIDQRYLTFALMNMTSDCDHSFSYHFSIPSSLWCHPSLYQPPLPSYYNGTCA